VHAMYLDDNSPIAGGREIWGFPKKLASPKIAHESETLVCTLHYGSVLCVSATMGYKHREVDPAPLLKSLAKPSFMIKIIPHVDCTPRICELVRYYLENVTLKGSWTGPAAIELFRAFDVRRLPLARARRGFGQPLYHRPDPRPWRGGARLFEGQLEHGMRFSTVLSYADSRGRFAATRSRRSFSISWCLPSLSP
jgi:Acetoacetate decarboxylase (ADC)